MDLLILISQNGYNKINEIRLGHGNSLIMRANCEHFRIQERHVRIMFLSFLIRLICIQIICNNLHSDNADVDEN